MKTRGMGVNMAVGRAFGSEIQFSIFEDLQKKKVTNIGIANIPDAGEMKILGMKHETKIKRPN
jgi:hypothetical protein